jgi:hypothetical protein
MNGFSPDRRPQQLAQMLAAQERNSSLNGPVPAQNMRPSLAYAGATPNVASGTSPQSMNFNGPAGPQQYRGPISNPAMSAMSPPQLGGQMPRLLNQRPPMMPKQNGMMNRAPQVGGMGSRPRMPSSPGLTTPQGGGYRGDFDYGQD